MATILNNKKSSGGSPYCYYTVTATVSNRTANGATISGNIAAHLASSGSSLGTGSTYGLLGYFKLNGTQQSAVTIKATGTSWSGTTVHNTSFSFTINNLTPTQTSIPVTFRVTRTGNAANNYTKGAALSETTCTALTVEPGLIASTITSISNGTTDYAPSVVWTPCATNVKFKLVYSYGSWSYTTGILSPNTTSAYTYNGYTITGANLAPYMSSTSGSFTVTLYTYEENGTTQIGSASTKNFTVTLNDSYKPIASIGTFSDAGGIVPSSWGIFVAGKSKLSFTVSGTASTGSSISSYTTTANGATYTTTSITTDWINNSGTVYTYVRDSRGRQSDTISRAYTVYPYSAPSITTATAERCLADGTLCNTGTYLKYSFKATYSTCNNHNNVECKLRYKTKTDSTYSEVTISNGASGIVLPNVTFSAGSSYDIQFAVTDTFTTAPVTANRSIGTGFRLVHYNKNHKAIAIGKQSEATGDNKLLEVALPLSFSSDAKKSVIDLIYPIGSVYISMGQNPNTLFGGTWVQL